VLLLQGIKVVFVASGSSACHSIIGDINGLCYTWGRNEVRPPACCRGCYCAVAAFAFIALPPTSVGSLQYTFMCMPSYTRNAC
jgi:hypothetical protein